MTTMFPKGDGSLCSSPSRSADCGKKDDVAKSVNHAIREVLKLPAEEGKRWAPWVIVNDVPNGNWGAGGLIRTLWEIGSYARKNVVALPDNHPASANGRRTILRCASADRRTHGGRDGRGSPGFG